MKQRYYIFLLFVAMLSYSGYAQKSILRLSQQTLISSPTSDLCLTEWKKKITNRK